MGDRVLTFRLHPSELEKWMHQNRAEYTGDAVEGCLLNSFVLTCKRGFAAVYEHYLTEWTSDYLVEFQAGDAKDVWKRWFEFVERSKEDGKESA